MVSTHADNRFIEALRNGDSSILKELYRAYAPKVNSWITKNSGSIDDARDVFQEAILALHTKACDPKFELHYPMGGLLIQICKNKWIDQLRKRKKDQEVRILEEKRYTSDEEYDPLCNDIIEQETVQKRLDYTFTQLSELCQSLLQLVGKGAAATEIATTLSMSDANSVYRRKNACIGRWRKLFQEFKL